MLEGPRGEEWRSLALCWGLDPEVFYDLEKEEQAQRVCALCSVRTACLEYALSHNEDKGVWGGATEKQRGTLLALRKMGRRR